MEKEQWVPLEQDDVVFLMREKVGRVVAQPLARGKLPGALVRERDGVWMKRLIPLVYLDPNLVAHFKRLKNFRMGHEVMASVTAPA